MAEAAQRRLQSALESTLDSVDKAHLRPMQKAAYLCMSKCFDNSRATSAQVSACQEQCGLPLQRIQQVVDTELNDLQSRVQRCAAGCSDQARDLIPAGAGPDDPAVEKAQIKLDACVKDCADSHVKLMPQLESRIKAAIR